MDKYQETAQTWNKAAKRYQEIFMDLELYNDSGRQETHTILIEKKTKAV